MKKLFKNLLTALCVLTLAGCGLFEINEKTPSAAEEKDKKTYEEGYAEGFSEGYQNGQKDGYDKGLIDGEEKGSEKAAFEYQEQIDELTKSNENLQNDIMGLSDGQAPEKAYMSFGFVNIQEIIPSAVVELRYYTTYNFVGDRIDGYNASVALLTKEAADALKSAADEFEEYGYRIKIYDAYRPRRAVLHFKEWVKDLEDDRMKEYFYPEMEKSDLFSGGYISGKSKHSSGSTVDLTLFDMETGKEVDMGGPFDYFGELSHPSYSDLTDEQKENRSLLKTVMKRNGFNGISTEWWHFTLNDEPYAGQYFDFVIE